MAPPIFFGKEKKEILGGRKTLKKLSNFLKTPKRGKNERFHTVIARN